VPIRSHLTDERRLAPSSIIVTVSAIRFLYAVTLRRNWAMEIAIPAPQQPKTLPVILSPEEVAQFLACVRHIRHRTILTVCYAAGLRVSEAVGLKVADVDSSRMVLRVEQGKGQKDRYVMLSPRLLEILRDWWGGSTVPSRCCFPAPADSPSPGIPSKSPAQKRSPPPASTSRSHRIPCATPSPSPPARARRRRADHPVAVGTPEPGTPRRVICGSPPPRCGATSSPLDLLPDLSAPQR
jgi:integrase